MRRRDVTRQDFVDIINEALAVLGQLPLERNPSFVADTSSVSGIPDYELCREGSAPFFFSISDHGVEVGASLPEVFELGRKQFIRDRSAQVEQLVGLLTSRFEIVSTVKPRGYKTMFTTPDGQEWGRGVYWTRVKDDFKNLYYDPPFPTR